MSFANPVTGRRTLWVVGVGVLLALGALGGVAGGDSAAGVDGQPETTGDGVAAVQEENNTTNVTVPIVDALGAAENETNGTAVGARLTRKGSITDLERPTRVYEVDVLTGNGTHFVVDVNATNGTVHAVAPAENETGFFESLFEDETGVPDERVDLDAIRSGSEAVELARNETGTNRTVTEVALESRNGTLVYTVETVTGEGARSTVVVAANPDDGDVLETEGGDEESE